MIKDLNRGITSISYNLLNLLAELVVNGVTHTYIYAANGRKLRVVQGSKNRDYAENIVYENGSLKRSLVDGGYIEDGVYHFYLNDHQGNTRIVATADGTVIQRNHFYPFGLPFAETSDTEQNKQPYKYNGKEFEREDGLNWMDYGARYYDPAMGRFTTIDPLAEKYYNISPYAYCLNNPVKYIDPTGMSVVEGVEIDSMGTPREKRIAGPGEFVTWLKGVCKDLFSLNIDTSSEAAKAETVNRYNRQLNTLKSLSDGVGAAVDMMSLVNPAASVAELGAAIQNGDAGAAAVAGAMEKS